MMELLTGPVGSWLLEQGPIIVFGAIGVIALWRQNQQQQEYLRQMLDECWRRVIEERA